MFLGEPLSYAGSMLLGGGSVYIRGNGKLSLMSKCNVTQPVGELCEKLEKCATIVYAGSPGSESFVVDSNFASTQQSIEPQVKVYFINSKGVSILSGEASGCSA